MADSKSLVGDVVSHISRSNSKLGSVKSLANHPVTLDMTLKTEKVSASRAFEKENK